MSSSSYHSVTAADLPGSMFPIQNDLDRDFELEAMALKCESLQIHPADILSQFGLVLGKKVSEVEYSHSCMICGEKDAFHIICQPKEPIRYFCGSCHVEQRKGNTIVDLIQLYDAGLTRNVIMSRIKGLIGTVQSRRNNHRSDKTTFELRREFAKKHGIYPATKPKTNQTKKPKK